MLHSTPHRVYARPPHLAREFTRTKRHSNSRSTSSRLSTLTLTAPAGLPSCAPAPCLASYANNAPCTSSLTVPPSPPDGELCAAANDRRKTAAASSAAWFCACRSAEDGVCGVGGCGDASADERNGDEGVEPPPRVRRRDVVVDGDETEAGESSTEGDGRVLGDERAGDERETREEEDDEPGPSPGRAGDENGATVADAGRDESALIVLSESMML